jgi:hypothetical protein
MHSYCGLVATKLQNSLGTLIRTLRANAFHKEVCTHNSISLWHRNLRQVIFTNTEGGMTLHAKEMQMAFTLMTNTVTRA